MLRVFALVNHNRISSTYCTRQFRPLGWKKIAPIIRYDPRFVRDGVTMCDDLTLNFMAGISDHGRSQHHLILLWPLNSMTCSFQLDHRPFPSKTVRSKHCLCSHIFPEGDDVSRAHGELYTQYAWVHHDGTEQLTAEVSEWRAPKRCTQILRCWAGHGVLRTSNTFFRPGHLVFAIHFHGFHVNFVTVSKAIGCHGLFVQWYLEVFLVWK